MNVLEELLLQQLLSRFLLGHNDERKLSQHLVGDSKVSCEKVF